MKPSVSGSTRVYLLMHQLLLFYACLARTSPNELKNFGLENCSCCGGPLRAEESPLRIDVERGLDASYIDVRPVCPDCCSLTRDDLLAKGLSPIQVGMDRVAEMVAANPDVMERLAVAYAGDQPYLRRVFLHELKPGAPLDPSWVAIYGSVSNGKVQRRPLLVPFPWRNGELICVGEPVKEALAIERQLAQGKGLFLTSPLGNPFFGGGR